LEVLAVTVYEGAEIECAHRIVLNQRVSRCQQFFVYSMRVPYRRRVFVTVIVALNLDESGAIATSVSNWIKQ
jgi:hypothetical protein